MLNFSNHPFLFRVNFKHLFIFIYVKFPLMPAKMIKKKQSKLSQKRPANVLAEQNQLYNRGASSFGEPISLSMMKEMDVMPLEDDSYFDSYDYEHSKSRKKAKKGQGENLNQNVARDTCHEKYEKREYLQPTSTDSFSRVSDEIILHIFNFLPKPTLVKCSAVCKRWRDISYDETSWRRYDFGRKLVKPHVLGILLCRGVTTLRLAISEIKSPVFSNDFYQASNGMCNLQYLDLSMATISASGLADIISVCYNLKKLSVENCNLNEDCCRHIAQNTEITVLNMAMCSGLTATGLQLICENCTKLSEWNLAWTDLSPHCMDVFLPLMPKGMTRLNLSGHRDTLDDNGLIDALGRCTELIELDISDNSLLTDVSFEVMLRNCPNLQQLHTSRSYNIPTYCNRELKKLKNFTNLEIFRTLTDEALASLREFMPEIQINQNVFSTIARPTTGIRRTSIWGLRVRD